MARMQATEYSKCFYTRKQYIHDFPVLDRMSKGSAEQQRWLEWYFISYIDNIKSKFPKRGQSKFGEWLAMFLEMNAVNPKENSVLYDVLYDMNKRVNTYELYCMGIRLGLNYKWLRDVAGVRWSHCSADIARIKELREYNDIIIQPKFTDEQHETMLKILYCFEQFELAVPKGAWKMFHHARVRWYPQLIQDRDRVRFTRAYNKVVVEEFKV